MRTRIPRPFTAPDELAISQNLAAAAVLRRIAEGPASVAEIAESTGVTVDGIQTLTDAAKSDYIIRVVNGMVIPVDPEAILREARNLELAASREAARFPLDAFETATASVGKLAEPVVDLLVSIPAARIYVLGLRNLVSRPAGLAAMIGGVMVRRLAMSRLPDDRRWTISAESFAVGYLSFLLLGLITENVQDMSRWSRGLHVASLDMFDSDRQRAFDAEQREARLAAMTDRLVTMTKRLELMTRWLVGLGALTVVAAVVTLIAAN